LLTSFKPKHALAVWTTLFLAVTILGAGVILGKKLGALFRG
jgi:hypothetical protein